MKLMVAPSGTPRVRTVLAAIGRTEDIRLSPNRSRLAIAAFAQHRIAVVDVEFAGIGARAGVTLRRAWQFTSPCLRMPHGLDFIDDGTLVVANRGGDVVLFDLPDDDVDAGTIELKPAYVLPAGPAHGVSSPGSVAVAGGDRHRHEVLICNNYAHRVTTHALERGTDWSVRSDVLLQRWLDVPDGVSVARDRRWMAISNHNTHSVLVYAYPPAPGGAATPLGILRGLKYPHGLRFSADGQRLLVADAGAPFVHVFAADRDGWAGVRNPVASIRVMDDATFASVRRSLDEGGPKGVDFDDATQLLVTTAENQALAFFDLSTVLRDAAAESFGDPDGDEAADASRDGAGAQQARERATRRAAQRALEVETELALMDEARRIRIDRERAHRTLGNMKRSAWWRLHERIVAVPGVRRIGRRLTSR